MNDPAVVHREYADEERFLSRRLATWAALDGPLAEDAVVDAVADVKPARVLDVGCGTGDFTERLQHDLRVEVVGLDSSRRMVDLTKARGINTVMGDIETLPFGDDRFDCVVANRVLYHLADLDKGLAAIEAVLRTEGKLVAVTYSRAHLAEVCELVGESPIATTFSAENGEAALRKRFASVEHLEITGAASFRTKTDIVGCLRSYGEFYPSDLSRRVRDVQTPLVARYRLSVFVAEKR